MKARTLWVSLLALTVLVGVGAAEKPAPQPESLKSAEVAKAAGKPKFTPPKEVYWCKECKVGKDKAGKCPMCGKDLSKMKAYVCEKCLGESDKAGNCGNCKVAMKSSKDFLAAHATQCAGCKMIHEAGKPCPACTKKKATGSKTDDKGAKPKK
ncbi:MAG: hypothetical protein NZT92_07490 [Abditibacteriales bacterium]|nr:hypothetical protein [Abditibacteriales bacterium]MDW8365794.1 hypothetical protein [Abditibacteriales bacterium]